MAGCEKSWFEAVTVLASMLPFAPFAAFNLACPTAPCSLLAQNQSGAGAGDAEPSYHLVGRGICPGGPNACAPWPGPRKQRKCNESIQAYSYCRHDRRCVGNSFTDYRPGKH